jgi:hypothetical protein
MDNFTIVMWCAIGGILIMGVYFMWKGRKTQHLSQPLKDNDPPIEVIHVPLAPTNVLEHDAKQQSIPQPSHSAFENSNPYGLMKPCRFGEVTSEKRVYITNNGIRAMYVNPQGMPLDRRYVASKKQSERFEHPPVDLTAKA